MSRNLAATGGTLVFVRPFPRLGGQFGGFTRHVYSFENGLEFLDQAGEWVPRRDWFQGSRSAGYTIAHNALVNAAAAVAQNRAGTNTITDTPAANPQSVMSMAGIEAASARGGTTCTAPHPRHVHLRTYARRTAKHFIAVAAEMTNIARPRQSSFDRMHNLRLVHSSTWLDHPNAAAPAAVDGLETSASVPMERRPAGTDDELPPLDPAVHAILEHVRMVPRLSQVIRARALARARAAIATPYR